MGVRRWIPPTIVSSHRIIVFPCAVNQGTGRVLHPTSTASKQAIEGHPPAHHHAVFLERLAAVFRARGVHGTLPASDRREVSQHILIQEKDGPGGRRSLRMRVRFGRGTTRGCQKTDHEKDASLHRSPYPGPVYESAGSPDPACVYTGYDQIDSSCQDDGCGPGWKIRTVAQGEPRDREQSGQRGGNHHGHPESL